MTAKRWIITGTSTGFGRSLAIAALERGDVVAGTVRKQSDAESFEALAPGRAFAVVVDMNDSPRAVTTAVDAAAARLGGLDVVVNNAGYGLVGAVEELSEQEARDQIETNFWGPWKVSRAALPHLKAAGGGRILNVSSLAGFTGVPGMALYNASKYALEGMSEGFRAEVKHLGIWVTIVEPGSFRTEWAGPSIKAAAASLPDYAKSSGRLRNFMPKLTGTQDGDPARAAAAMIAIVECDNPPVRLLLGDDAVDAMRVKLASTAAETDAWESLSRSTSYSS
ncbi:MAG: oxidoreductase [Acidimicrobiia bacterium]